MWWLVGIVAFIAVTGFLVAPPIVKWQAEKRLTALLNRAVTIEKVSINPFRLSADVSGFRVVERDGPGVALGFDRLHARLSYQTFLEFAPVIAEARLEGPVLHITRTAAKAYSFQDLLGKFGAPAAAEPAEAARPTRFSFNNLQLLGGLIAFDDQAEKQKHEITGINISIPFISNFDAHVATFVQPRLEAVVNGDAIRITGETKPFHGSLETRVALNLTDVDLPRYLEYSPIPLPFTTPSGKLDAALTATLLQTETRQTKLIVSGNAAVREFELADAGGKSVLAFRQLGVVVNGLDVFGRKVDIARIGLESPALDMRREKDGSLSVAKLVPRMPAKSESRRGEKEAGPFAFEVGEIAVTHGLITVADLVPEQPFRRRIDKLELRVRGLGSADSARASVEIGFDSTAIGDGTAAPAAATSARVDYAGEVQLAPLKVGGKLQVLQLKLADLYPYYESAINAKVQSGTADVSVAVDIAVERGEPTGRVSGVSATLSDVRLQLPDSPAPFLEIPSASLEDGEADLATRRVTLGKSPSTARRMRSSVRPTARSMPRACSGPSPARRSARPRPRPGSWR
ncbi:MAG: DUF748 domain-containing protein [Gammaproteobacteria bacterium]|nr:DUF748 domain-containing protein [Gammaproteobacteria bacterium]